MPTLHAASFLAGKRKTTLLVSLLQMYFASVQIHAAAVTADFAVPTCSKTEDHFDEMEDAMVLVRDQVADDLAPTLHSQHQTHRPVL